MRRLILPMTIAVLALLTPVTHAQEGSGGKNVVLVRNVTDNRTTGRAGVLTGFAGGQSAVPENLASASSSCENCRTVAVAMQAVLVTDDPEVIAPRNVASAANAGCSSCFTVAYAWQYVLSVDGPAELSSDAHTQIASLRARASAVADSTGSLTDVTTKLDQIAAEFKAIVLNDAETIRTGPGVAGRRVDIQRPTC